MMEREEILKLLAQEDVGEVLQELYIERGEFDKVNNKREQLLGEKKTIQNKLKGLEEEVTKWRERETKVGELGFDIDNVIESLATKGEGEEDVDQRVQLLQDRLAVQKETYEAKLASQAKDTEKKLTELSELNQQLTRGWDVEKIENTINAEFDRIGVLPIHRAMLRKAFVHQAKVEEDEDGVRSVLLTNDAGLKTSATDFFDSFAQGEEGKSYIAAPTSTGGGALGGKGGKHAIDYNQARLDALQRGDVSGSIGAALAEFNQKQKR